MAERINSGLTAGGLARVNLQSYQAVLPLGSLVVGVDNIHHDVYLSQPWCEQTRAYLLELVRQKKVLATQSQSLGEFEIIIAPPEHRRLCSEEQSAGAPAGMDNVDENNQAETSNARANEEVQNTESHEEEASPQPSP